MGERKKKKMNVSVLCSDFVNTLFGRKCVVLNYGSKSGLADGMKV